VEGRREQAPYLHDMIAALIAAAAVTAGSAALGDAAPVVSTAAGSGAAGAQDGPAADATFGMPTAVAVDASGRVYVADGGGNRIRVVAGGRVRTLAGDGAAGDVDGPASAARFDMPEGVAVARDGTVYVADTGNHDVRAIAPDGTVSTFAGSPSAAGDADGTRSAARFGRPTELALEPNGALLVADPLTGLRRIAPDGAVTTVPLHEAQTDRVYGVAVGVGRAGETIFVADAKGLLAIFADGRRRRLFAPDDRATASLQPGGNDASATILQARDALGFPHALAALDDRRVFFTDLRTDTVRLVDVEFRSERVVAGADVIDGSGDEAAFADGPGASARFDAPFGLALGPGRTLYVADAGNRRIRRIDDPGPGREPAIAGIDELLPNDGVPGAERTIITGNSISWSNTQWSDSIEGIVERDLRARDPAARVLAVTVPGAPTIAAFGSYLEELADAKAIRRAVLLLGTLNVMGEYHAGTPMDLARDPSRWRPAFAASLRALDASLRARGVELVVVVLPASFELSPAEDAWEMEHYYPAQRAYPGAGTLVRDAVAASGVRTVDGWPAFLAVENAPQHAALFGSADAHLTRAGRALVAGLIADALR